MGQNGEVGRSGERQRRGTHQADRSGVTAMAPAIQSKNPCWTKADIMWGCPEVSDLILGIKSANEWQD